MNTLWPTKNFSSFLILQDFESYLTNLYTQMNFSSLDFPSEHPRLNVLVRTGQLAEWIESGHPVQFLSCLIVPSPRPAYPQRRGRAKNARPILGRRLSRAGEQRWKKQRGRERRPAGGRATTERVGGRERRGQEGSQKMWGRRFGRP